MHSDNSISKHEPFVLQDLDEAIVPSTPVTTVAGGVLLVVVILAMVPGAVDTSYRKS